MVDLKELYCDKIDIIVIYISEAHAEDEWPISNIYLTPQHKTLEDRLKAAQCFVDSKKFDPRYVFVDSISEGSQSSNFESVYAGWPERGYIFFQNKIQYITYGETDASINWDIHFPEWIEDYFSSQKEEVQ